MNTATFRGVAAAMSWIRQRSPGGVTPPSGSGRKSSQSALGRTPRGVSSRSVGPECTLCPRRTESACSLCSVGPVFPARARIDDVSADAIIEAYLKGTEDGLRCRRAGTRPANSAQLSFCGPDSEELDGYFGGTEGSLPTGDHPIYVVTEPDETAIVR